MNEKCNDFTSIIGTALEFYWNWISRKDQSLTKNAWNTFFLGFGIYGNTSKWLDTNIPKSSGHLGCIDGIRFLSMAWVVLGHAWPAAQTMNLKYPKNWFFVSLILISILSILMKISLVFRTVLVTFLCNS